jgi:histone-lysine N-methyltransferase SETMAR
MIYESLIKLNSLEPFLKRVVTGDEKWIVYDNSRRKRSCCGPGESSQSVAKADLHPKKVILSMWWDWRGVLYFELLPCGQTIDAKKYCAQLENLKRAVAEKRPELANRKGVVFHHDNAKPHTALVTKQKLKSFGWEVMQHPPYSPDIAPSDYHLFRSLQNNLDGQHFESMDDIQKYLEDFFAQKSRGFYENGIMSL